ncbi:MAG TPA: metal-dependent hydrolase [Gemmatimonadaceae bacterium]|nr:metal-dependent hydrolase [Gemmatimonadaceae bacterium]
MASAFTHAIAGLALGTAFRRRHTSPRYWIAGAVIAALPDVDGVGFWLGVPYESTFGHRGFTHSIFFAALIALAALIFFRDRAYDGERPRLWTYLFLATASHGVLDAMTTGGGGIAFFAPFVNERYFFPWRPILVSPMSISRFFSERGLRIIASEIVWVWIPAGIFAAMSLSFLRAKRRTTD